MKNNKLKMGIGEKFIDLSEVSYYRKNYEYRNICTC